MVQAPAQPVRGHLARGFVAVTAANLVGNLFAYGLLLTAARVLADDDYAGVVALLNLLLVGTIPAFALQAVAARRVATGETGDLVGTAGLIAAGGGVVFLAAVPLEITVLNLPGTWPAVLLACAVPGITVQGFCQGSWQGQQQFPRLALATFTGLVGRAGGGLAGLVLTGSATGALAGLALGVSLAAAANLWGVLRRSSVRRDKGPGLVDTTAIAECAHAGHAYGAFLVLSVTDLLLANHVLDPAAAAVYAAGSVMTKIALWLPQSVANVLFAAMTDPLRHRRLFLRTAAALIGIGVVVVIACRLAGGVVVTVLAGSKFAELQDEIWLFAALGSALALLQFALVSGLAIRDGRAAVVLWLTVAAQAIYVLGVLERPDVTSIISGVVVLDLVAAAVMLVLRIRRRGSR